MTMRVLSRALTFEVDSLLSDNFNFLVKGNKDLAKPDDVIPMPAMVKVVS